MNEINSRVTRGSSSSPFVIDGLERVLHALAKRGITISNAGRVPTYIRTLKRLRLKPRPLEDPKDVMDYLTAMVEGQYVLDAYEGLICPPEVQGCFDKLKQALKGRPDLTADDPSRDTMVELVVASCAHRGGNEVHLEEPDVCLVHEGQRYGVAAKRIRSLDRLQERTREGANQVQRSQSNGFVVIDLTIALGFHEGIVAIPRIEDAKGVLSAVVERISEVLPDDALASWLYEKPLVVGVVGFAYVRGLVEDGEHPLILRIWGQRPVPTAAPRAREFFRTLPLRLHLAGSDSSERERSEPFA